MASSSTDLDIGLRAYVPAFEQIGAPTPAIITASNIAEARRATGLTWEPAAEPQFRRRLAGGTALEPLHEYSRVDGLKYVTRDPGGPVLGSAKSTYTLFSNAELFAVAEAIGVAALHAGRAVRFVSGGELDGGRKVFLLADLGVTEIPGDPSPHVRYMTLLSSHDGSGAVKVLGTDMRWFCTNALRAVELAAAATGAAFSFRHTAKLTRRLADAQKAITAALVQHDSIETVTRELLTRKVSTAQASQFLSQYALARVVSKGNPQRAAQAALSPQRAYAVAAVEAELRRVYASTTCDGIRDTAYGPLAAVVEYLDNTRRAAGPDARFTRTMIATEPGKVLAHRILHSLL